MTNPTDRLRLLNSHLKLRDPSEMAEEFPMLPRESRQKYFEETRLNKVDELLTPEKSQLRINNTNGNLYPGRASSQANHSLVMIPGPIEFSDNVLSAMSTPSQSHTSAEFVDLFSKVLRKLRLLFGNKRSNGGQPLVISGSGTLGWDILGSNVVLPTDNILCVSTGFFSNGLVECLKNYVDHDNQVTVLEAGVGEIVPLDTIREELSKKTYSIITITQTDTSTGVLADIEAVSKLAKSIYPNIYVAVDAVCSAGVEEIQVDNWKLDFVLTASQKALASPAGLSVIFISERCIERALGIVKKKPLYTSLNKWLPIMQNYENKKPSYFATPSVQLVSALNTSLLEILGSEDPEVDSVTNLPVPLLLRFKVYKKVANKIRDELINKETGLQLVSVREHACNGMSALYVPSDIAIPKLLAHLNQKYNITLAGGIHPKISTKYIRIGHMGVSVINDDAADVERVIQALKLSILELRKN